MADKMRRRYGDTNPVIAAVDADTVIEIGDLVYLDTDDAKPYADGDYEAVANPPCEQFKKRFLGVAMQRSRAGDTDPIRVATTGVFEHDCPSDTYELGDLIGARANQEVEKVSRKEAAVGRVATRRPAASTSVLFDIRSTVMTGGV